LRSEPNDNFWKGGQDGYFELYRQAARALKAASSRLKVGGPATCCADCWIGDFVRHMDNHSVPYDFISTHAYSSCELDRGGRPPAPARPPLLLPLRPRPPVRLLAWL
jgi:beta-xylosidase